MEKSRKELLLKGFSYKQIPDENRMFAVLRLDNEKIGPRSGEKPHTGSIAEASFASIN